MKLSLTPFEIEVLDMFVPTHAFDDLNSLGIAMYGYLEKEKPELLKRAIINADSDFQPFAVQTSKNIAQFLTENEFHVSRDGVGYILTEKGRHLKLQGSLEKYMEWERVHGAKLLADMHTIQQRGYLDSDQPTPAELKPTAIDPEKRSNIIYYILIIVAIVVFCLIGKYHKFD